MNCILILNLPEKVKLKSVFEFLNFINDLILTTFEKNKAKWNTNLNP